jgi:hypothetical protein
VETALAGVRALSSAVDEAGTPADRAGWLSGLREVADAAEALFATALRRFDVHGDGETLHGAQSSAAWLRGALRLAPGDASERVRIARASTEHLREQLLALAEGEVTYDQVRAIERSVRPLPPERRAEGAALLGALARQVDAGRLRAAGQALRHTVDPDGAAAAGQERFDRRYLHLSPLLDGMTALDGLLDPEATAALGAALAPFLVPTGPDDERTAPQRRADGLVEVARVAAASAELPVLSGALPQLEVVVPLDRLTDVGEADPAMLLLPVGGSAPLEDAALQRLGCDASVARIVLAPDSVPIDVGRSRRLFSAAQRRALAVRDGGCRWPGCGRPARYTDAHHVVPWSCGGSSDLTNAVLLCRHHHRLVHEGGWTLGLRDPAHGAHGVLDLAGPRGQRMQCPPRGP